MQTNFEEPDQIGHDHQKRSFLVRSQEAVNSYNHETMSIMKQNGYHDPPRTTGKNQHAINSHNTSKNMSQQTP